MRAVLTNFGSTGDIQPLIALAVELQRHDHDPLLLFPPQYQSRVESLGLEFRPTGPDLQENHKSSIEKDIERVNAVDLLTEDDLLMENFRSEQEMVRALLPQLYAELQDACRSADVLISGHLQPLSLMLHEMTGIPFVSVYLSHLANRGPQIVRQANEAMINDFRRQLGLAPLSDPLSTGGNSPQLALYAMSRHVSPPMPDWPEHYQMPGYFFLDEEWEPELALSAFIAGGESPVIISFGSMTHDDPQAVTDLLLEAVRQAGCRAIIQQGWSGLATRTLPPHVFAIDFTPHHWLFPRASCVIHHGGAGTSGAVFRAGVPSVFVPHAYDQFTWSEIARDLGCAGPPVAYTQLTSERLSNAITATLRSERYHQAAAAVGEKIRAEQGIRKARLLIEEVVHKIGLHPAASAAIMDEGGSHKRSAQAARRKQLQQKRRTRLPDHSSPPSK